MADISAGPALIGRAFEVDVYDRQRIADGKEQRIHLSEMHHFPHISILKRIFVWSNFPES
jgi:hypothetical protein